MSNILELRGVSYLYSEKTPFEKMALKNVNYAFERGKITGLIGHTGSGKSTLVQLLNGLLKPSFGQVLLDGRDIWENPKEIAGVRFRVGLVFQYPEYQLFEETVYKDIAFGPGNMGLGEEETDKRVREAMRFVGLGEELLDSSPFELSGGQKRRVAMAGVIAMFPDVLVLDEPAAGLDPTGREDILGGIRSFQRSRGSTVIIVSHSMEDMARYADCLAVMQDGTVIRSGTVREIFSDPAALTGVGLDIPMITRFMIALADRGIPVSTDIFTVDDACAEIRRIMECGVKPC